MYPPDITKKLLEYFEKITKSCDIQVVQQSTLLECYKCRLKYGCVYPEGIEKELDRYHKACWKKVGPPWWVDLLS